MSTFAPAKRINRPLKIGLIGESGSGKTYTALLLARGLVGPGGKIALIDTENGRSLTYGEGANGEKPLTDFDVLQLDAPYTVDKYIKAINEAIQADYGCVIVDSITHEWDGPGGLLDQHDKTVAAKRSERKGTGLIDWKKFTSQHKDFIDAIINSPANIICTVRAKRDYKQIKDEKTGQTEVVFEGLVPNTKPSPPITYEFDMEIYLAGDHRAEIRKGQYIMPTGQPRMLKTADGEALREWQGKAPAVKGKIYQDKDIREALVILGKPQHTHQQIIQKQIGDLDPDAQETIDKLQGRLSREIDKMNEEAK